MSTKQLMAYCKNEEKETLHIQETPNHILHLILSIVTGGIWIIMWILMSISGDPAVCTTCGSTYTDSISFIKAIFSFIILGAVFLILAFIIIGLFSS